VPVVYAWHDELVSDVVEPVAAAQAAQPAV
jgi:hypothetical protein